VFSHSIAVVTAPGSTAASADAPRDADEPDGFDEPDGLDEPRGSRLDHWFARTVNTPAKLRLYNWGLPAFVTLVAIVARLWALGDPHSLIFDETFYVKDAWTLLHKGWEAAWPANIDQAFADGDVNSYTNDPEFVAHPPFGKWMMAVGLAIFGAENAVGWRISTAVVGILAVVLLMLIAKRMFRSTLIASVAGFIMAIDGNAIVMSRVAILDDSVMFLALLAFGCLLLDRSWHEKRLAAWVAARVEQGRTLGWGPWMWWRPWLLAAGILLGLDAGVKWTGFYFLAFFAVYVVLVDVLARRRAGVSYWPEAGILKGGIVAFVLMVPVAFVVYVGTWAGWLLNPGGYYRDWVQTTPGAHWTGALSWVPDWAQNLWHYQSEMYGYSINLHTPHPYQSNPLTWLLQLRPTSMYYLGTNDGSGGCTSSGGCASAITDLGNPIIWWAGTAAVIYLIYRLIRYRDWRNGMILMGLAAGYLPWMLYTGRTIFTFYSIAFAPYLYLALAAVFALVVGRPTDESYDRVRGLSTLVVFLVIITGVSVFFYPIWTGMQIPFSYWQMHMWLPNFTTGIGTIGWI
jgi:dolichyl-phosphate-mannose--protein O-mannosyl transferase